MKNIGLLSIVTAMILLNGCGEDSKKTASEATTKAVESTKEATADAVDASKEAAAKAVEAAKEATAKAVEASKKAAEATKEAAKEAVANVTEDAVTVEGAALYVKCKSCHGADGKTKALGKSELLAGLSKEDASKMLHEYKAGTRNVAGMGTLMKGQVASLDDKSIDALATYIATLK